MTADPFGRSDGWLVGLAVGLALLASQPLVAFESSGRLGGCEYTVLSPDWIWQGEGVSLLLVVRGVAEQADLELAATPPAGGFESPDGAPLRRRIQIRAGETVRQGLTGFRAATDAPLGVYSFVVHLRGGGDAAELTIPIRTVRGAVVPPGWWSILVPALLALLTVPALLWVLRRHAKPGAWRQVASPVIPSPRRAWWEEV